jgi:recombination protein RecT
MASNLPAARQAASLRALLEKAKDQIAMALPRHMTAERMIRVVMTAVQRTPQLMECSPLSILGASIQASQLGLEPDGLLGRAYLVPRRNRKTKQLEACFQPGYLGLIELAQRSGKVSYVAAELVWTGDEFAVTFGLDRSVRHVPALDDPARLAWDERTKDFLGLRGAYAVVRLRDGSADFEYLPKSRLSAIREFSASAGSELSPYNTCLGLEDMYRKAPIRRLLKRCPLSPEVFRAAQLDELVTAGAETGASTEVEDADQVREETEHRAAEMRARYGPPPEAPQTEEPPAAPKQHRAPSPGSFDIPEPLNITDDDTPF